MNSVDHNAMSVVVSLQGLTENTITSTFLGRPKSLALRVVLDIDTGSDQFNQ